MELNKERTVCEALEEVAVELLQEWDDIEEDTVRRSPGIVVSELTEECIREFEHMEDDKILDEISEDDTHIIFYSEPEMNEIKTMACAAFNIEDETDFGFYRGIIRIGQYLG